MKRMLLFIDTETTGLPKYNATNDIERWPRIVQLAWSLYDTDGNRESQNSFIIYPTDFTIPMDSARIHGITTERAKNVGVSLHKVLPQFNADVEKAKTIIAHNLDFDLPIVNTEFIRCKLETNCLHDETPGNCLLVQNSQILRLWIQVADLNRVAPAIV